MKDLGAMGYARREVEVVYLSPLFMIISSVEENIEERPEWKKINLDVNEMGLKFP